MYWSCSFSSSSCQPRRGSLDLTWILRPRKLTLQQVADKHEKRYNLIFCGEPSKIMHCLFCSMDLGKKAETLIFSSTCLVVWHWMWKWIWCTGSQEGLKMSMASLPISLFGEHCGFSNGQLTLSHYKNIRIQWMIFQNLSFAELYVFLFYQLVSVCFVVCAWAAHLPPGPCLCFVSSKPTSKPSQLVPCAIFSLLANPVNLHSLKHIAGVSWFFPISAYVIQHPRWRSIPVCR